MAGKVASNSPLLVLAKISTILDAFTFSTPERSLADLRTATGLPASTVQRLVANLVQSGFLDRHGDQFRIGLRMATWAASAFHGLDVGELAQPVLAALRDETGETACLFISTRELRVCVAMAESRHSVRRVIALGEVSPVNVGSSGRVLLAWNDELAARVFRHPLTALTEETVVDVDELRRSLITVREHGCAYTVGERTSSVSSVAAPVFQHGGSLFGALSLLGPSSRMTPDVVTHLTPSVVAAGARLSQALGSAITAPN